MMAIDADPSVPSASVRREIAALARQKKCRDCQWTKQRPTEWRPHAVRDAGGEFFTDAGAWELLADLVEGGHPMREVVLRHPPGKRAYEMKVQLRQDDPELYIKVALGSGTVIGYSFHESVF